MSQGFPRSELSCPFESWLSSLTWSTPYLRKDLHALALQECHITEVLHIFLYLSSFLCLQILNAIQPCHSQLLAVFLLLLRQRCKGLLHEGHIGAAKEIYVIETVFTCVRFLGGKLV